MRKINAIDLDKTLIPFDSFRFLVLAYLKEKFFFTPLTLTLFLRKIRLIESTDLKYKALVCLRKDQQYKNKISDLACKAISQIEPDVLKSIQRETDTETTNILISASSADYVKLIAKELGWSWIASDIVNGEFVHCHGLKKKELILLQYPLEEYEYNYAISDSQFDLPLLKMFKKFELIN